VASEVDISNLAMSHIGQDASIVSIDPSDGSAEADHCARFYPIARDQLLEIHSWRFATTRATLSELALNPSSQWAHAYSLPNGCVRPLAVLLPEAIDDTEPQPYKIEVDSKGQSMILYTNAANAALKYIIRQTNTTMFSPLFVIALSYLLGAYTAGPITKDLKLKSGLEQIALARALDAMAKDADSELDNTVKDYIASHLKVRAS
jgi:hypothetical protein